jgi:Rieske Fe-S protein
MTPQLDRRRALAGTAAVGIALPVLAACSADFATDTADDPQTAPSASPSASPATSGDVITTTAEVPVGGGRIFPDQQVVVTQPTEGEFKCFTAVCTHQGCIVSSVSYGGIRCECHGSGFSIEDGSAVNPPATRALAEMQIKVKGDTITLV